MPYNRLLNICFLDDRLPNNNRLLNNHFPPFPPFSPGSSAGAINATYYLAEQPEGVRIYHEDIANKRFVDLNRLMKAGAAPVLDLDFLLGDVMHGIKPLDWDAVLQAEVPLKVVASSLDTLQAEILDDFADKDDLLCCLRV